MTKGVLSRLVFTTKDVDATFERVRTPAAAVIQAPIDQPWRPSDCAFRDPDGNVMRFNQKGD